MIANVVRTRAMVALLFGAVLLFGVPGYADEPDQVIRLKHRDNAYLMPLTEFRQGREVRFKREPSFGGHKVYRTALVMDSASKDFIGMVWDATASKLYLDLNQNLDLTDEAPLSPRAEVFGSSTNLKDIRFQMGGPPPRAYQVDISISSYGDSVSSSTEMRSGWEGQVQLGDESWTLAVIDNLDGAIDRNDTLLFYRKRGYAPASGQLHQLYGMRAEPEVCVGDKAYRLAFSFESAEADSDLVVRLHESTLPAVSLGFTGSHVERIKLEGSHAVVLDAPHGIVRIPSGSYTIKSIYVYDPASRKGFVSKPDRILTVSANSPATLKVGAPLDNRTRVTRSGSRLNLDYELVGGDGEIYTMVSDSPDSVGRSAQPPQFAVYKDGKKIAAGAFEYG